MASSSKRTKIEDQKCKFGVLLKEDCHQRTRVELVAFSDLENDDQVVYTWRAGIEHSKAETICRYHENVFSDSQYMKDSKCCNPLDRHKKKKINGTLRISLHWAVQLKEKNIDVVPGWKVCRNCYKQIKDLFEKEDSSSTCDKFYH